MLPYLSVPSVMPLVSVIPAVNGAVNEARQVSLNISINVSMKLYYGNLVCILWLIGLVMCMSCYHFLIVTCIV